MGTEVAVAVEQAIGMAGFWLTLAVTALALWKGGCPEQIAVLGNLVAVLISPLLQPPLDGPVPYWPVAAIDATVLVLLAALLVCTGGRRLWLYAAGALQLLTVLIHIGVRFDFAILARGYIAALEAPYFLLLFAFAAGVGEAWWKGDARPIWRSSKRSFDPDM
jgi:hypothetical protein